MLKRLRVIKLLCADYSDYSDAVIERRASTLINWRTEIKKQPMGLLSQRVPVVLLLNQSQ